MHTRTYLIVPAETDMAGQCRIVMHLQKQTSPLQAGMCFFIEED